MKNLILIVSILIINIFKTHAQEANIEVIFLETYFEDYMSVAQKENQNNLRSLYLEKVRLPIFQKYFMQSEYAPFMFEDLAKPSLDLEYLKTTLKSIEANKKSIEKITLKALKECKNYLNSEKVTVYVIPPSSEYKKMISSMSGVFGFTAGSKQIVLSIDPEIEGWKEMLAYAVAHEYHHMVWTQINFHKLTKWTLLDYLVFEGKGDYFAKQLYPEVNTPWTEALNKDQKLDSWNKIQSDLDNQDFSFQAEVMFGSDKFPLWGGYSLGYDIVKSSLEKEKSTKPEVWINYSSEKMVSNSNYN